jgi:hypothetical protein
MGVGCCLVYALNAANGSDYWSIAVEIPPYDKYMFYSKHGVIWSFLPKELSAVEPSQAYS